MSNTSAHILVYPFPASGHIIPLLDLTRLLLTRGLTVTVLVSPSHLPLLQPLLSSHASVQPLVLSPEPEPPSSSPLGLPAKIRATAALYDPILQWFRSHPHPPVAIVSDFFLGWTHRLATDLGVPRVAFWPSGAFAASITPHIRDPDSEVMRNGMLANFQSWGAVFNSFTELERVYIDHVKKEMGHKKVWAVGPLLPPTDDQTEPTDRGGSSAVPAHEVMTWLDGKRDESVVYVCFGSRVELTSKQTEVLAAALERSEVHFIWCVQEHVAGESVSGTRLERTRVKEMCKAAWNAVKGGSSTRDLDELVEKLMSLVKINDVRVHLLVSALE
ncbi:hypothetical protein C3L33_04173, partial [Rhododendron williamsianum]